MGVLAREAGKRQKGTIMKSTSIERRHAWRSLSKQDKQERLVAMRLRHQSHVELEIQRLQNLR